MTRWEPTIKTYTENGHTVCEGTYLNKNVGDVLVVFVDGALSAIYTRPTGTDDQWQVIVYSD